MVLEGLNPAPAAAQSPGHPARYLRTWQVPPTVDPKGPEALN